MAKPLTIILLLISLQGFSQIITRSVIGSMGNSSHSFILAQTIGQPSNTRVFTTDKITLRQGHQQPINNHSSKTIQDCEMTISPNPGNDYITIDIDKNNEEFIISIFDINGRNIFQQNNLLENTTTCIEEIPAGIYIIKTETSIGMFCTQKLIIVK